MSTEPTTQPNGRIRRAREPVPRHVIQKVKLTVEERDQLRARAAELGVSVPRLMVKVPTGAFPSEVLIVKIVLPAERTKSGFAAAFPARVMVSPAAT